MKPSRDAILAEALQLDADDRAVLVNRLLDSIHDRVSADVRAAWVEESERRLEQYRENPSAARPLDTVMQQLRKRHS
ncbi:MAG: addiction module protein [Phycisphaerales bacterium]